LAKTSSPDGAVQAWGLPANPGRSGVIRLMRAVWAIMAS
jgi:hypothetical protein